MSTSQNIGGLEITIGSRRQPITKEGTATLLRAGQDAYNRGDYHTAAMLSRLSSKLFSDLGERWYAHIANGWYEFAKEKLQTGIQP